MWIGAWTLIKITCEQVVKFITDIIHHFGVSNLIIMDNGTQFTENRFLEFCDEYHICVDWAVVAHPLTNGQVERVNRMIIQGLKSQIFTRLKQLGQRWPEALTTVL
jgi:IS30 family transposase